MTKPCPLNDTNDFMREPNVVTTMATVSTGRNWLPLSRNSYSMLTFAVGEITGYGPHALNLYLYGQAHVFFLPSSSTDGVPGISIPCTFHTIPM